MSNLKAEHLLVISEIYLLYQKNLWPFYIFTLYLGNARLDLNEAFRYLFVFWALPEHIKTENLLFPPPGL